ncbi:Zinc finger protein 2 [Acorus gramineus]|uniref:Zinc finger protein 2 n=1 Tax=Acorus gramineus TaxID=55184 RepID=A0AAV9BGD4_ACOGR|nr:Zinc finger protein 2 [Acorus gramineus]
MEFRACTSSLDLTMIPQDLNLELGLEPTSDSTSNSNSCCYDPPRIFSCNYCQRKFYSSQALGGHQNAHKLERSLAKRSREMSLAVQPHSVPAKPGPSARVGVSPGSSSGQTRHGHGGFERRANAGRCNNVARFGKTDFVYELGEDKEDLEHLDLSLRL